MANGKETEQQIANTLAELRTLYETLVQQQATLKVEKGQILHAMAPLRQQLGVLQEQLAIVNRQQEALDGQLHGISTSIRRTEQLGRRHETTTQLVRSLTDQARRMQSAEDSLVQAFGNVVLRALTKEDVLQQLPDLVEDGLVSFISNPQRNRLQVGQRPNSTRILLGNNNEHAIIYHPMPNPNHFEIVKQILNNKAPEKGYSWANWTIVVGINTESEQIWSTVMGIQKPAKLYSELPVKLVNIYNESIIPVLKGIGKILQSGAISMPKN